jgi:hypothetical protein
MSDIGPGLERKSRRFELAPGALGRLFERHRRKQRNRKISAGVVAFVIAGLGTWGVVSTLREAGGGRQPAASPTASADAESYALIAGVYATTLRENDPDVVGNGMAGTYTMRLKPNGVMHLRLPPGFQRAGESPTGINFRLSGNQFTTNAFVNLTCADIEPGVYRWELTRYRLTLIPLVDECEVRAALFGSQPWRRGP